MTIDIKDDLDLRRIASSGQCFRWKWLEEGSWRITAFSRVLYASQKEEQLRLSCTREEYENIWKDYLDMGTNYRKIRESIPQADRYLREAASHQKGIRILRQDPWEMIITFILSQRKNIPAITLCVEKLCRAAGDRIGCFNGEEIFAFPRPEQILSLSCQKNGAKACSFQEKGLGSCSLGYRMPYVRDAAEFVLSHPVEELAVLEDGQLRERLLSVKGIGVKVAACVMLFGFHRMDAFPVDVWIDRALKAHYPEGFAPQRYSPYAGLMQQYLFMEERAGRGE